MPPPVPKQDEPVTMTIRLDGVPYVFHPMDVSAFDESKLRQATGFTIRTLMEGFTPEGEAGLDSLAAVVWLARRQNGEPELPFRAVAELVKIDTDFDIVELPESEADDAGEVPAAS